MVSNLSSNIHTREGQLRLISRNGMMRDKMEIDKRILYSLLFKFMVYVLSKRYIALDATI